MIILLHIGFFYALQSGLLRQAAQAIPQEVFVNFITPEPRPQTDTSKPAPAAPEITPVVKEAAKQAAKPSKPIAPAAEPIEQQQAITAPPFAATQAVDPPATAASTAPPAPVAPSLPKTISGVEYIQAPQPDYPPISKRMGEEGKVILRVFVNEKGRPERVEIQKSSGSGRLDEAARQAVLRALFKPYTEDGKALAVFAIVPIKFQLDN